MSTRKIPEAVRKTSGAALSAVGQSVGAALGDAISAFQRRERMSSIDTAWLRMDTPSNLMMIVGVHVFDTPLDYQRLRALIEERLLRFKRFRQRVVQDATGAWWELDTNFDLDLHLHRISLPGDGGKHELEALVADMASQQLDHGKPLWQMHLVENYNGLKGEQQALIVRIHHCIADGIALIGVLMSMTDSGADGKPVQAHPVADDVAEEASENFWDPMFRPIAAATVKAIEWTTKTGTSLSRKSIEVMSSMDRATEYVQAAGQLAKDVAEIALMKTDTPTRFKGKPGITKVVAWTEPLPLTEIKAVGKALGCSVNDVLLSSVAGALRAYLVDHGDAVDGCEIRAMVPVNLRPAGQEHQLGNHFGLVPLVLPVGIANPVERLYEVQRRMAALKRSFQPLLAMSVLGAVGYAPRAVQNQALNLLASKATAVMTNVPGPTTALYMAGARMSQVMFWVPQSGNIGMGVSILSYADGVQFGLITDKKLVADPQTVIDGFAPEFEKLVMTLLMAPWGDSNDNDLPAAVPEKKVTGPLAGRSAVNTANTRNSARAPRPKRKPSAFAAARGR